HSCGGFISAQLYLDIGYGRLTIVRNLSRYQIGHRLARNDGARILDHTARQPVGLADALRDRLAAEPCGEIGSIETVARPGRVARRLVFREIDPAFARMDRAATCLDHDLARSHCGKFADPCLGFILLAEDLLEIVG